EFGEADAYLTVFSKEEGKLSLLAKGIRRVSSRRAPHLETFSRSEIYVHETTGGNLIVTQARVVNAFPNIRKDIKKVGLAFYAVELTSRLTREYQEHAQVFDRLALFLTNLSRRPLPEDPYNEIIKAFQSDILQFLGFGTKTLVKEQDLRYYVEELLGGNLKSPEFLEKI
ncbi:MAG: DNA repair protein RecO, partial [bacterium]